MARLVIGQKHGYEGDQSSSRASWNTPHATPRAGISYGGRMALSFALTSLVTVMILASVVMVVWGGAFFGSVLVSLMDIGSACLVMTGVWIAVTLCALVARALRVLDAPAPAE